MTDSQLLLGDCVEVLRSLPEDSVDAVVTDPPYGLEFMDKAWDRLVVEDPVTLGGFQDPGGGNAFTRARIRYGTSEPAQAQAWHERWAREAFRVLKPGGHLLAFGGSRTYHRLACAVEDAGFEIRDQLQWLYGSGFPKSLDVAKQIDRRGGTLADFGEFRDALLDAMAETGVTRADVTAALGNEMASHYLTRGSQPAVPNLRDYLILRDLLDLGERFDDDFLPEADRPVVGEKVTSSFTFHPGTEVAAVEVRLDVTAPATDEAQKWHGWGSALKPAHEPIVLARKPFGGTLAANVLAYGTGALNVDACRIDYTSDDDADSAFPGGRTTSAPGLLAGSADEPSPQRSEFTAVRPEGRWPANVLLDPEAAALLDRQSDAAGASRFFYVAKASAGERHAGLETRSRGQRDDGREPGRPGGDNPRNRGVREVANIHPTVKPVELMRHLIRLVTPPGGLVLDPFAGSGTTGIAAHLESKRFLGIEIDADYHALAQARLDHWTRQQVLDLDA